MEKEKPRLARLTAIITQLQSKHLTTAREIAEKHDVSIRTVYRDIRTLEKSGIPIYTEEGKGYSLVEGYKLPPVMFTENEANAMITAEKLIDKNKDHSLTQNYKTAIEKIKAVLRGNQKEKADLLSKRVYFMQNLSNQKSSSHLMQIQNAITEYQVVHIGYTSLVGAKTDRDIEPFALYSTQNNWILIAYCRLRADFRSFRLDCIHQLHVKSVTFEPHQMTMLEYFQLQAYKE